MARYNPFFEKAGMLRVDYKGESWKTFQKALEVLGGLGFNLDYLRSKHANLAMLTKLSPENFERVKNVALWHFIMERVRNKKRYEGAVKAGDPKAIATVLSRGRYPCVYLVWKNPDPRFTHLPNPRLPKEAEGR